MTGLLCSLADRNMKFIQNFSYNIKLDIKETGLRNVDWIAHLGMEVVISAMSNLHVPTLRILLAVNLLPSFNC
jgi:hypothetical protein